MVRSELAPSTEHASLLITPVKVILPLPPRVGVGAGSSAKALPEAAIMAEAITARENFFMMMSVSVSWKMRLLNCEERVSGEAAGANKTILISAEAGRLVALLKGREASK